MTPVTVAAKDDRESSSQDRGRVDLRGVSAVEVLRGNGYPAVAERTKLSRHRPQSAEAELGTFSSQGAVMILGKSRVQALALLALAVVLLAGCISFEPQIETGWIKDYIVEGGGFTVQYPAGRDSCWRASERAVGRLGLRVDEVVRSSNISGTLRDDTSFSIELRSPGLEWTEIRVKVGLLGDEDRSMRIHRAIAEELQNDRAGETEVDPSGEAG